MKRLADNCFWGDTFKPSNFKPSHACTARQQLKRIREFLKIRTARIYVNGKGETRCVWGPSLM